MTDFAFLWDTLTRLLTGAPLTLKLASGSVALGAVLALLLTAMRMSPVRRLLVTGYRRNASYGSRTAL